MKQSSTRVVVDVRCSRNGVLRIGLLRIGLRRVLFAGFVCAATRLSAQSPAVDTTPPKPPVGSASWTPEILGTQITVIGQKLFPFHSSYSGVNSLTAHGDEKVSHTYGVYLGARPFVARVPGLTAYLDVEMARGKGVGRSVGLAGVTNGDAIRQGSGDIGNGPYVARAFLRYTQGLHTQGLRTRDAKTKMHLDTLERSPDQLADVVAARRVEITAGKLAVSDLFDQNRYANSPRRQFMNWGLFQNTAWDFAADTRGFSNGVAIAVVTPRWMLRAGSFQMPIAANGNKFDAALDRARGNNVELTLTPAGVTAPVIRLLGYVNHARMGDYREAIAAALAIGTKPDTVPDIVANDRPERRKYGVGLNAEQPLADSGETGAFIRLGWNDGRTESFAFTEVDRHASTGVQLSGRRWSRTNDRFGAALAVHGLSTEHREYLARGGAGFLLGDGALRYGPETVSEAYYRMSVATVLELSPDVQHIWRPGYNRDRGPVTVASLRVNIRY